MNTVDSGAGPSGSEATDVFISYSRKDKAFVTRLHAALLENGRTAWVDWEGIPPTARWRAEIEAAIINGQSFVFVVSPSSASSDICAEEAAIAERHNKKIIPLVWEDVDPSRLSAPISSRQWIFSRPADPFDGALHTLLDSMDTDLDWVRAHTRLLYAALRWQADKERVSLLEGSELEDAEAWLASADGHEQKPTAEQSVFIAASRWHARLEEADTHYEKARHLSDRGRLQAAGAHLLRAVELAPQGGAPEGYPATRERPDWAEEAWTTFQYLEARRGRLRRRLSGHQGPISNLAISADGRLALSASFDGTARIWSLDSGTLLHVLSAHRGAVGAVAFSPRGEVLTAGEDGALYAWDPAQPKPKPLLAQPTDPITAIAFDAAGRTALGLQSGHVVVLSGESQPSLHERMHGGSVTSIAFHDSGRRMATASGRPSIGGWLAEGTVKTWDFEAKKERALLFGTVEGSVVSIAISPDGTNALRSLEGGSIEVWDLANAKQIRRFEQPQTARCLAYSPDGSIAASGSDDSSIRLWNTHDWSELRILDGHLASVTALLFGADGKTLLSGSIDTTVAVWNLDEVPETRWEENSDGYGALAVCTGNAMAALGCGDGSIQLWDGRNGERRGELGNLAEMMVSVALRADGGIALSGDDKGCISVWNIESGVRTGVLLGHEGLVWDLAFSPDATLAVSASGDRTARIWDLASGTVRHVLAGHTAEVLGARFLPDGMSVVSSSADGSVRVWSVTDGRQVKELRDGGSPNSKLAIAADGRTALVGSNDGSIRLWDIARGTVLRRIEAHEKAVSAVALSDDGTKALSGSFDHTAIYWDLQTGAQLAVLAGHDDNIYDVAFAPDGSAVTASLDSVAAYWNLNTGRPNGALQGHTRGVSCLSISANGETVVTGSLDKSVRVWDGPRRSEVRVLQVGHLAAVDTLAFTEDGSILASGSRDGTLRFWRAASGEQVVRRIMPAAPTSLAWMRGGRGLLCGTGDRQKLVSEPVSFGAAGGRIAAASVGTGGAVLWDFHAGPPRFLERHDGPVAAVAITPDGRRVLSASDDASVRVWDITTGRQIRVLKGHRDRVWGLAVSPDGRMVATGSLDTDIRIWNVENGTTTKIIDGHTGGVGCVAFSVDGTQLVSASADRTVRFWELKSGAQLHMLQGHEAPVTAVALSPDGRCAVTGSSDADLRIWDLTRDAEPRHLLGHTDSIDGVAITPDGRTVVSCSSDGTARVWDLDSGETRHILNAHGVAPKKVAIGPDGATAALAYEDYAVRLWDLATGELRSILSGHRSDVLCVAFSKSGARLVSGSHDAKVLVWDPQQDEPLRAISGRPGDVLCVALNPGGTRALIGAENGLRLWDPTLGEEIAELTGHSAPVTGVVFGPDGVAASCSMDGSIRLWDITRRRAYHVLTRHKGPVVGVAFTADGRALVAASEDGTLSAWSVRTGLCLGGYGKEVRQAFELPAVGESGATMQLAFKVGDIPRAIAMSPGGQHVIVGSSRGANLLPLFHPDTPLVSPRVYADGDPYRDFAPLYASLGLRVARDGSDADKLELNV